jgi:hypothetical protein
VRQLQRARAIERLVGRDVAHDGRHAAQHELRVDLDALGHPSQLGSLDSKKAQSIQLFFGGRWLAPLSPASNHQVFYFPIKSTQ